MNYFKDENDNIFAYDDEQVSAGYGSDFTAITEDEKDELIASKVIEVTYTDEEIIELRAAAYADSTTGSDRLFIEYQALLAQDLTEEAEEAKTAWLARRDEIKSEYPLAE